MDYTVLLFYKYVTVVDPETVAQRLRDLCQNYNLLGRGIVATEGINVTIEGHTNSTEHFIKDFLNDARFEDISVKRSSGTGAAFPKLSIKVRDEIVGTHFPSADANPRVTTAPRITPDELHALYESDEEFHIVDMRNDYELKAGSFANSINPELESSRNLPAALPLLEPLKHKKVITVCTGGVRCEKMSAYLMSKGFEDVYQLENGIHGYMEKYPDGHFAGALYTFDQRVTMDFGGNRSVVGKCERCGVACEEYVNCANLLCHKHFIACKDCGTEYGTFCSESCEATILAQVRKEETQSA